MNTFNQNQDPSSVDVLVIGGGAAGLSGALQLVRQRRSVLVLDAGEPRNAPAVHLHSFLGHDGLAPAELLERGRAEVAGYGGLVRRATVVGLRAEPGGGFVARTAAGDAITARRVLVASGVRDVLPVVRGLAARWGRDVVHCPYCHGWEVRERPLVVLGATPMATHSALLFANLGGPTTLVTHGAEPSREERALLGGAGVRIVDGPAAELVVHDDALAGVRLADGSVVAAEAVAVQTGTEVVAPFLTEVGLGVVEHPSGAGQYVPSSAGGATEVPGLWVAGNVADPSAQLVAAASQGALAGAMINADLVMAEARAALGRSV